ncbi:D-ribose pyranase [Pseudomonas sp. SWRI92]|uniref:D-ribose pyranase n=1 Tax=Pseudomonas marvdashtae TaxID=2745500 RepID=A0A923JPG8_9PSED|nr:MULTISPECIES: D-ribose pyranase [Pseudomonas]MBC3375055.1 D-ribose pyranase [Pseudomonas sp. SWRI92]MBV4551204.1 D-ribose pyranase [Pseudomonas marvdashtae]
MKKTPLLNIALSRLIASLGHGDKVVIGDAGLPVPPGVELIDLALTHGVPDFVSTLKVVLSEMQVESHVLAEEILDKQPSALATLEALHAEGALGARELVRHEQFKILSRQARAIIRTGECSPYCNVVLIAGVTF